MAVRKLRPTTPGQRFRVAPVFDKITTDSPEKSLTKSIKRNGGRNNQGRMTVRNVGGGHKKRYREIDFKREKFNIPATVKSIEYDPNRSARIALLYYADGEKRYMIAPEGLEVGQQIVSGENAAPEVGNTLPLGNIPLGTIIHNIELKPGKGAQLARSAGASARVMGRDRGYVQIRLTSGEMRKILGTCMATIGQVGNLDHGKVNVGKAGRSRWLGKMPHVRGVVMNPVDHPHGGGEGKAGAGNPHPVSPWGQPAKGFKTRKPRNQSSRYIIANRNKKTR